MLDLIYLALGAGILAALGYYARAIGKFCGLAVVLGLAIYLVVTLVAPERF